MTGTVARVPRQLPRSASARAANRATASSPLTVRVQGLVVALIAAAPLTVGGHYLANIATGDTTRPVGLNALWLFMFLAAGVVLVLAALSSIVPGWRSGGIISIAGLVVGLVIATLDWQQLTSSWSGFFLNAAGAGIVVGALQSLYWSPRGRVVRIGMRGGERVTEWLGGMLMISGLLSLLLPHLSTVDGAPEDCAPLWPLVEPQCFGPEFVWWPIPIGAALIGLTILTVLHHDPVTGRKTSEPDEPYLDLTQLPPPPPREQVEGNRRRRSSSRR